MFDIGFTELLLISIVALLVLGPERLPQAVRTAALWIGRARRSFNKVRTEIEQQLNTDEIRRQLHNESILKDLEEAKNKASDALRDTEKSINALGDEVQDAIQTDQKKADSAADNAADSSQPDHAALPEPATEAEQDSATATSEAPSEPPAPDGDGSVDEGKAIHDFYNNPPGGMVSLKGGQFSVAPPDNDGEPATPTTDADNSKAGETEEADKTDKKSDKHD